MNDGVRIRADDQPLTIVEQQVRRLVQATLIRPNESVVQWVGRITVGIIPENLIIALAADVQQIVVEFDTEQRIEQAIGIGQHDKR